MKEMFIEDYEIHRGTMALMHYPHERYQTKVLESGRIIYTPITHQNLLKSACYDGGASLEGRRKAVVEVFKYRQRTPFIVSEQERMIVFPTHSPEHYHNVWLFYHHIKDLIETSDGCTVIFNDLTKLHLDVSYYTMNNQLLRSSRIVARFFIVC